MVTAIKKIRCMKCPYYLGQIKFIISPCPNCKVNGGTDPPPCLNAEKKDDPDRRKRLWEK